MALVLADRVQQTGTANTTVSFTLSGAVVGFQSFAVIGNTNTTYYSATDASGNWETGLGTYSTTGPTLTRTTIYQSSNSNAAVTFVGAVNVFVTYPSGRSVNQDGSGNVGIGTSSPATKLQVAGITKIGVTGTNGELQLARTSDGATITTFLTDGTSGIINSAVSTTFQINTAEAMRIDSSGNVLVTSAAGLGYGTGSGGTVTQSTSKSTGVTLNKPTGLITMSNASLGANTNVSFLFTNSIIVSGDLVLVNIFDNASLNTYQACAENSRGGSVYIMLRNTSGGALAEPVVLSYAIIKATSF